MRGQLQLTQHFDHPLETPKHRVFVVHGVVVAQRPAGPREAFPRGRASGAVHLVRTSVFVSGTREVHGEITYFAETSRRQIDKKVVQTTVTILHT